MATHCRAFLCFVLFVALLLSLVGLYYDNLFAEGGAGCFAFPWFVMRVLSIMVCLLFLLVHYNRFITQFVITLFWI